MYQNGIAGIRSDEDLGPLADLMNALNFGTANDIIEFSQDTATTYHGDYTKI